MKAKRLRKLLKKAPKGAYVKILTYGYSQGMRYRYDPDPELTIDNANNAIIITVDD
jgi:hypothetical protein